MQLQKKGKRRADGSVFYPDKGNSTTYRLHLQQPKFAVLSSSGAGWSNLIDRSWTQSEIFFAVLQFQYRRRWFISSDIFVVIKCIASIPQSNFSHRICVIFALVFSWVYPKMEKFILKCRPTNSHADNAIVYLTLSSQVSRVCFIRILSFFQLLKIID